MGLHESSGNLSKAYKQLLLKWRNTRSVWNDEQSENFDKDVMAPIERAVRSASEAIDTMNQAVQQAKRDCS